MLMPPRIAPAPPPTSPPRMPPILRAAGIAVLRDQIRHQHIVGRLDLALAHVRSLAQIAAGCQRALALDRRHALAAIDQAEAARPHDEDLEQCLRRTRDGIRTTNCAPARPRRWCQAGASSAGSRSRGVRSSALRFVPVPAARSLPRSAAATRAIMPMRMRVAMRFPTSRSDSDAPHSVSRSPEPD